MPVFSRLQPNCNGFDVDLKKLLVQRRPSPHEPLPCGLRVCTVLFKHGIPSARRFS